jgi:hypothetical protein
MLSLNFPFILAGPIIRRVDPTQVYIWIALSEHCMIEANFYEVQIANAPTPQHEYHDIHTITQAKPIQLGKNLFIYLIKITPSDFVFPSETLIGYNLQFTNSSNHFNLGHFGLLTPNNPQSIVYGQLKYPTFFLKKEGNPANIFYGSCRKLHGEGEDTLVVADLVLEKESYNILKRPDTLFLLGDQIYADDIADPLFPVVRKLGEFLIGRTEDLHKIDERLNIESFQTSIRQINGRQFIMENLCQFTSTHSENHLMSLGEYAALYLISWSPALWELSQEHNLFLSFDEALENNEVYFAFRNEEHQLKDHLLEKSHLQTRYLEQQETLVPTLQNLYKIRRLLANTPSYMIFDDHDITDDWNLSYDWKQNVYNSPLGKHVIANGLSAYWAFQGWGNQPDRFDKPFLKVMKKYFHSLIDGEGIDHHEEWVNLLWNFNNWHFVTATSPKAIFLDTRTQREYGLNPQPVRFIKKLEEQPPPPILLSKTGWTNASELLIESEWITNSPLIIVSATPVYGLGLIESFLNDYIYPLKVLGVEIQNQIDFEAWKYNTMGFTELLLQIAEWNPSQCIILSGDVHYASSVKSRVTFQDGRTLNINQFTSSPIKNMSFSGFGGRIMKMVTFFNSWTRKNKNIHRFCDHSYHIVKTNNHHGTYIWKDSLTYQPLNKNTIIETENNLGLLIISEQFVLNKLLKK